MVKAYRLGALTSALAIAFAGASVEVAAQGVPQRPSTPGGVMRPSAAQAPISQPVVQPVPGRDGMALDAALGRLARDPRDIGALIDAGNAALAMGDVDAATGFFRRADQVSPGNPRVKAGLAGAMVRNGDPFGAIPLFEQAEKAGAMDVTLAADRGLAYDLVGDNATAQRFYRQSLARMPSDEAIRRLALSLAISGDKHNAELILSPLLQQRNLAAWRTRAFVLAILGQTEEAVSIANTILPSELATGVAPYLRYMPRLTHAQQAAAANFGAFPRASEIGRDDPRVAQYAPKRGGVASADAALVPQGEALGRKGRGRDRDRDRASRAQSPARGAALASAGMPGAEGASQTKGTRIAPPDPQPAREVVAAAPPAPVRPSPPPPPPPQIADAPTPAPPAAAVSQLAMAPTPAPAPAAQARSEPAPVAARAPVAAAPARSVPGMLPVAPGFSLAPSSPAPAAASSSPPPPQPASPPPAPVVQPVPAPAPVRAPAATVPRSLADAFAEFNRPSTDVTPAAGAVDLRRIRPSRPKVEKPPEPPKPPSHPSRIWVQVATGRDKAALAYDWRRFTREGAEALRGKAPFISAWGQTNRLLTGPFPSEAAANSLIAQLRRADVEGAFVWTSPAGQVVDALAGAAPRR